MTRVQKLQLRQSELRQKLGVMLDTELEQRAETFEDDLAKLNRELRSTEVEVQSAILAEPEPEIRTDSPEGRELRSMVERAHLSNIVEAALERRSIDGVERELQAHFGLAGDQVPLALLLETRAVTPAPGDVGVSQQPIIQQVFPDSVSAFLGVDMPTVGVGDSIFPVLTSGATAQTPAENAVTNPTDDTGAFSADVLSPARLQTSFLYSREDRARFAGMDAALRENLSMALADGLDKQVIAGASGLLHGTNLADHDAGAETTFAKYKSDFAYGRVDGKYAGSVADLRIVMGSATYAHAANAYRANGNNADAVDAALSVLMADTGGVRVSAHVPPVAATKQDGIVRLGMRRDMVAPIWEGITLITDEVTKADNGQIKLTAVMLHAVKILRSAGFYKQETQHA